MCYVFYICLCVLCLYTLYVKDPFGNKPSGLKSYPVLSPCYVYYIFIIVVFSMLLILYVIVIYV